MILDEIRRWPLEHTAIIDGERYISYGALLTAVEEMAAWLQCYRFKSVVLKCDNRWQWVAIDLACQLAQVVCTPIPAFFSASQQKHIMDSIQADVILSDCVMEEGSQFSLPLSGIGAFSQTREEEPQKLLPDETQKITFTSGSSGAPKGVCLSLQNQFRVANSLVAETGLKAPRHLCVLPLTTLLENIAGVYAPLMSGGTLILADEKIRGFNGSQLNAPAHLLSLIEKSQPESMILVPELLLLLLNAIQRGWVAPDSLQFIAVGGSKVSGTLIRQCREQGLPVFQGYGLSECASVVSLSTQNDNFADSVGQVLPHLKVSIDKGQIIVSGNSFLGYINEPDSWYPDKVKTGDLGRVIDDQLVIEGREKNLIINSYGRNIAPEWVESELMATGAFSQVVLIGDARPFCSAILVPFDPHAERSAIEARVAQVNLRLPDYAQIKTFIIHPEVMNVQQGLYTANGRPQREQIAKYFSKAIQQIYSSLHQADSIQPQKECSNDTRIVAVTEK